MANTNGNEYAGGEPVDEKTLFCGDKATWAEAAQRSVFGAGVVADVG